MANLEYGVPITPRSPFYIGSMSKQFTAACIALLVQRGKLRLTDPVRKYVPELPDYGVPLTIENLIHHTGGVREWSSLVLFAGQDRRFEQHVDNRDMLRLLLRQKALEFVPGSQYRYSSGGYILLAEIIERVTGQSLRAFARENLFQPLGMHETFYDDNYAEIVPGRVESYRRVDANHYERLLRAYPNRLNRRYTLGIILPR